MAEVVYSLLKKAKKKLAICESCTGGLISKRLTDISGSSKVFTGGVVAYSNESKEKVLGIPGKLLQEKGAVSYEVASEMAKRVLKIGPADYGLSTTGIAGPSGGTPSKPVGLVYIGLAAKDRDKVKVNKYLFSGNREEIRLSVSQQALALVKQELSKCSTLLK
jgi:nicotinamide-nucleotide amidase